MAVDWTPHRFSGGTLALDVANTVVHRGRPAERFDRFDEAAEIGRFARAVAALRPGEFAGHDLGVDEPSAIKPRVVAIREATDALFREAVESARLQPGLLAPLLRAVAEALEAAGNSDHPSAPLAFDAALGLSALALTAGDEWRRVRICPACGWLFADRSRNGSRTWCDMAVCGNRQKARRHYRRQKLREDHHA